MPRYNKKLQNVPAAESLNLWLVLVYSVPTLPINLFLNHFLNHLIIMNTTFTALVREN